MTISQQEQDGVIELIVAGRLDAMNAHDAESKLVKVLDAGHTKLLIDFSKLDYISSAGLRVLLVVAKRVQQSGGRLVLCALQPMVQEVFDISGFSSIFKLFATNAEAMAFLKKA